MSSEQDITEQALEAFMQDGGTLAMLNEVSSDTLEQLYALGFNQYDASKYEEAHKIFQALCVLDHYEARFFLGLGACRQALGQHQLAIDSYSYGAMMDLNETPLSVSCRRVSPADGRARGGREWLPLGPVNRGSQAGAGGTCCSRWRYVGSNQNEKGYGA